MKIKVKDGVRLTCGFGGYNKETGEPEYYHFWIDGDYDKFDKKSFKVPPYAFNSIFEEDETVRTEEYGYA